jgi:hypothetical protein
VPELIRHPLSTVDNKSANMRVVVPHDVHSLPPEKLDFHLKRFLKFQKHKAKFSSPLGYKQKITPITVNVKNDETASIASGFAGTVTELREKNNDSRPHLIIPQDLSPTHHGNLQYTPSPKKTYVDILLKFTFKGENT